MGNNKYTGLLGPGDIESVIKDAIPSRVFGRISIDEVDLYFLAKRLIEIEEYKTGAMELISFLHGDYVADLIRRLSQIGDSLAECNELITNMKSKKLAGDVDTEKMRQKRRIMESKE